MFNSTSDFCTGDIEVQVTQCDLFSAESSKAPRSSNIRLYVIKFTDDIASVLQFAVTLSAYKIASPLCSAIKPRWITKEHVWQLYKKSW